MLQIASAIAPLSAMNRQITLLFAALFLVAAAVCGYVLARPNPLTPRLVQLEYDLKLARDEIAALKAERAKLLSDKRPEPQIVADNKAKGAEGVASADKAPADNMSNPLKRMEAPGMKEMIRKQQEVQVDMTYGKLFQKLSLNEQERENFRRLLSDRVNARTEASMKLMDGSLTADQRKAIATQLDDVTKRSDNDIRTFLNNDEDYKTYQRWEDTQSERMQLQIGGSNFDNNSAPLSDEQREQLIDVMANVRKSPSTIPDLNDPRNITPDSLSPDNIAKQLQRYDLDAERVLKDSAAFLGPEQIDALKKMQAQMRTLAEAGMRMSGQMLGKKQK